VTDSKLYPVPESFKASAHLNKEQYDAMYKASVDDPDSFWREQASAFLDWITPFNQVQNNDMGKGELAGSLGVS
jgi:acetyl-CoA synthetase